MSPQVVEASSSSLTMGTKKPYLTAIFIQSLYAGMFMLSKAALNGGMNNFVFTFYRQAFATIFLVPVAIIFERKGAPRLSYTIFFKMFMLALFGITFSLDIYSVALEYTSSTLAAATSNTLPVITFLLAFLLRMEIVNLRRLSGKAKVAGVVVCLAGAAVLAFYKGPHLKLLNHHHPFGGGNRREAEGEDFHQSETWIKGCFLMLLSNTLWGLWLVLQVHVLKSYPSKLLFTTMQCLLSTIQSFLIAIAFERDSSRWKLGFDIGLLAVAYCGVVVTGISYYLQTWVIEKKGPVFLAMFSPLSLVATIICSTFLLGEVITLGSVVGGVFLVSGLYTVLWGKNKEEIDSKLATEEEKEFSEEINEIIISPI